MSPKAILSTDFKRRVLSVFLETEAVLSQTELQCQLCVAVNPAFDNSTFSTTAPSNGDLAAAKTITAWAVATGGGTGKVFRWSNLMVWLATGLINAETIVGIKIADVTGTIDDAAYLPFESPIEIDEATDTLEAKIEFGFDSNEVYVVARVIPLGQ